MSFDPDPSKQTREVIFSPKINQKAIYISSVFNNDNVFQASFKEACRYYIRW